MNILDFKKNEYFVWMDILDFKKMNILFEWIFWIKKKWFLNEYSRLFKKWIFVLNGYSWFLKMNISSIDILVLVCLRQKQSSPNVSNSSKINQGSLVGLISVHFRGPYPIQGPQEGSEAIFWPYFLILNDFPPTFLNE